MRQSEPASIVGSEMRIKVRSDIVHANPLNANDFKNDDGSAPTLQGFTDAVEADVRQALKAAIPFRRRTLKPNAAR